MPVVRDPLLLAAIATDRALVQAMETAWWGGHREVDG